MPRCCAKTHCQTPSASLQSKHWCVACGGEVHGCMCGKEVDIGVGDPVPSGWVLRGSFPLHCLLCASEENDISDTSSDSILEIITPSSAAVASAPSAQQVRRPATAPPVPQAFLAALPLNTFPANDWNTPQFQGNIQAFVPNQFFPTSMNDFMMGAVGTGAARTGAVGSGPIHQSRKEKNTTKKKNTKEPAAKGGKTGRRNYSSEEKDFLLTSIEKVLPANKADWKAVLKLHEERTPSFPEQDCKSLQKQFKTLAQGPKEKSGETQLPPRTVQARSLERKIDEKTNVGYSVPGRLLDGEEGHGTDNDDDNASSDEVRRKKKKPPKTPKPDLAAVLQEELGGLKDSIKETMNADGSGGSLAVLKVEVKHLKEDVNEMRQKFTKVETEVSETKKGVSEILEFLKKGQGKQSKKRGRTEE